MGPPKVKESKELREDSGRDTPGDSKRGAFRVSRVIPSVMASTKAKLSEGEAAKEVFLFFFRRC